MWETYFLPLILLLFNFLCSAFPSSYFYSLYSYFFILFLSFSYCCCVIIVLVIIMVFVHGLHGRSLSLCDNYQQSPWLLSSSKFIITIIIIIAATVTTTTIIISIMVNTNIIMFILFILVVIISSSEMTVAMAYQLSIYMSFSSTYSSLLLSSTPPRQNVD